MTKTEVARAAGKIYYCQIGRAIGKMVWTWETSLLLVTRATLEDVQGVAPVLQYIIPTFKVLRVLSTMNISPIADMIMSNPIAKGVPPHDVVIKPRTPDLRRPSYAASSTSSVNKFRCVKQYEYFDCHCRENELITKLPPSVYCSSPCRALKKNSLPVFAHWEKDFMHQELVPVPVPVALFLQVACW